MSGESFDWKLHAPMVFRVLTDSEYLKGRGVELRLEGSTIHRTGGWGYSPSEIDSFRKALMVLRDNGAACGSHFAAICLLEGVSYHKILDSGRELLKRIFNSAA